MKPILLGALFCCLPLLAQAEDITQAADPSAPPIASGAQPKFFSLDEARSGRPSFKRYTDNATKQPMRSDSTSMNNGFFRIDRQGAKPQPLEHALVITPSSSIPPISGSDDPRIIRGVEPSTPNASAASNLLPNTSNDPILSLFNADTNRSSSFRDTLLGRSTPNRNASPLMVPSTGSLLPTPAPAPATAPLATEPHSFQQLWPIPISSTQKVSSGFGYRADPLKQSQTQFHNGIDIAAPIGTPVLAAAPGHVTKVGRDGAYGNSITIANLDGSESKYGHLSAEGVNLGQSVKAGETIGAVGATGRVTGPHLDYRVSMGGQNLDPLKVLTLPGGVPVDSMTPVHAEVASADPVIARTPSVKDRLIVVR